MSAREMQGEQYDLQMYYKVHAFLDWWESPDAYFEPRKAARLRDVSHAFISYATRHIAMHDYRAMKWYNEHKELLWKHRSCSLKSV